MSEALISQAEDSYQRGLLYLDSIRGKLRADYAQDDSDAEIERILEPCVCGHFLVPCAKAMRDRGVNLVPVVDTPEVYSIDDLTFAEECLKRGLCPACLNAGVSGNCALDLFGNCRNCGWNKDGNN